MRTHEIDREWMVALCGRDRSQGALRLANWLADHAGSGGWALRGVHVIRRDPAVVRDDPELMESARRRIRHEIAELVTEAGASRSLGEIELIEAGSPEDGLLEMVRAEGGTQREHGERAGSSAVTLGVVIGRSAGAVERRLVRLGRTARRLLYESEVPVVVAGPDLDLARLESGPVVVMVGLTDRDARATGWARDLASRLERTLRLVHVAAVSERAAVESSGPGDRRLETVRERAELALAQWQADHGLEALSADVVLGDRPVPQMLAYAEQVDACVLVCGTRQLDLHEQASEPSLSVELASISPWPVVVVPSPPPAATRELGSSTTVGGRADGRSPPRQNPRAQPSSGSSPGSATPKRPLPPPGPKAHGLVRWA